VGEIPPVCTVRWTSPLGAFDLVLAPEALRAIRFGGRARATEPSREARGLYERLTAQLGEYFAGRRRSFDLPLDPWPAGTDFQAAVWEALKAIPYGQVASYGDVAAWAGRPRAVRAVGQACGANRIPLVIPCHRVVAKGGLGGFGGGTALKARLLHLEQAGNRK